MALAFTFNADAKQFVVVIDPGHGGTDPGAVGRTAKEKAITLNVSKKLGEKINNKYKEDEVKVVFTRSKDVSVDLWNRGVIANNADGNLFISIHVNDVDPRNKNRTSVAGAEVYTCGLHKADRNLEVAKRENSVIFLEDNYKENYKEYNPNSPESSIAIELRQSKYLDRSIQFAILAEKYLTTTAGRRKKGVKQAGFQVLWSPAMPSVLVELDFICNPTSEKFLASADGVDKLSKALFEAFEDYYTMVKSEDDYSSTDDSGTEPKASSSPKKSKKTNKSVKADTPEPVADVKESSEPQAADSGVEYRVQVLANDRRMSLNSKSFKGETVGEYHDKGMYKYTVGSFATQAEAEKELRRLKQKFSGAFIIKMENGKRVY